MKYFVIDETQEQAHSLAFLAAVETSDDPAEADALVVFGGDGAMLHNIQDHMHLDKPFLGINAGTRGYLMNNTQDPDHFHEHLAQVCFQELWLLEGLARTTAGEVTVHGFNDIWVERRTAQTLRMRITVDGSLQPPLLVGDGILFCTPQGSTGYNLALRGKPTCPTVPVLQVTPMACLIEKSPVSSLMLSDTTVVSVDFEDIAKRPGRLFHDGIHRVKEPVERLTVRRSARTVRLGFLEEYSCLNRVLPWQLHY
jgi:NAD kinase